MLGSIIEFDQQLFIYLNSLHTPWLDSFFFTLSSNKISWLLFSLSPVLYGFIKFKKKFFLPFFLLLMLFGISDSLTSKIMKPGFARLRPCHQEGVKEVSRLVGYKSCGGKFGFVSSHASNTTASVVFLILLFIGLSKKWLWYSVYAILISYSRVYLGKHYPMDILYGAITGLILAVLIYKLYRLICYKLPHLKIIE
jgi:undecaprenyl-diphosphatase